MTDQRVYADDPDVYLLNSKLKRYFEASVESCPAPGARGSDSLTRNAFWEEIYRPRRHERVRFEELLRDSGTNLIVIAGQVGCGKSTFVLEKIENRRPVGTRPLCSGVHVNLEKYQLQLHRAERDAREVLFREPIGYPRRHSRADSVDFAPMIAAILSQFVAPEMDRIIAEAVREQFNKHFRLLLANSAVEARRLLDGEDFQYLASERDSQADRATVWEVLRHFDVSNRPFVDISWPDAAQENLLASDSRAATAAALVLSAQLESHRIMQAFVIRNSGLETLGQQFEAIYSALRQRPKEVSDFLAEASDSAHLWLRAYAAFFPMDRAVLAIDNGDCLAHVDMHRALFNYADELAKSIGSAESSLLRPLKVVLSMREQNLDPGKFQAEGTRSPSPIVLGSKPYGLAPENSKFLSLTRDCIREILQSRLALCRRMLAATAASQGEMQVFEAFRGTIDSVWLPIKDGSTPLDGGRLPSLQDLSNESIRIGLAMVRHSSIAMVYGARHRSRRGWVNYGAEKTNVQSSIIGWLFHGDESGRALQEFIRKERETIRRGEGFCCSHRMVLTFLFNRMESYRSGDLPSSRTTVQQLLSELQRGIGLAPSSVQEALWFLYKPGIFHREYITIEQARPLFDADSIDANARVYINRRGRALIRTVVQTVDYWARLAREGPIGLESLCDREPPDAVSFARRICEIVEETGRAHIRNWASLVLGDAGPVFGRNDQPFLYFRDGFMIGHDFFVERVSRSHTGTLTEYATCLLRNMLDRGSISKQDYEAISTQRHRNRREALRELYMTKLDISWHSELGSILELLDRYNDLIVSFGHLKAMTLTSLEALVSPDT